MKDAINKLSSPLPRRPKVEPSNVYRVSKGGRYPTISDALRAAAKNPYCLETGAVHLELELGSFTHHWDGSGHAPGVAVYISGAGGACLNLAGELPRATLTSIYDCALVDIETPETVLHGFGGRAIIIPDGTTELHGGAWSSPLATASLLARLAVLPAKRTVATETLIGCHIDGQSP